jgi:hypothetical protein
MAITPGAATLPLGTVRTFTATATYTDATTQVVTSGTTWSSTDSTVVDVSNGAGSHGLATTLKIGEVDVLATYNGHPASSHVKVTQAALVSIDLTPFGGATPLGFTRQFIAIGTYSDSTTQVLTSAALWASSDETRGLMSTVAVGPVTISATYSGITGTSAHAVTAAVLTSIDVTPVAFSVAAAATRQLTATGNFSDATTQDLTSTVTWSSTASGVVQVSNVSPSKGLVTGIAAGAATIKATSGVIEGDASVTVP